MPTQGVASELTTNAHWLSDRSVASPAVADTLTSAGSQEPPRGWQSDSPASPGPVGEGAGDAERELDAAASELLEPLDPLVASLTSPLASMRSTPVALASVSPALDQVALQLVRRFSAGASSRGATVRMEFSAGPLAGASIVVTSDAGALSVAVDAPAGFDAGPLAERLRQRLEAKGLRVETLECH